MRHYKNNSNNVLLKIKQFFAIKHLIIFLFQINLILSTAITSFFVSFKF